MSYGLTIYKWYTINWSNKGERQYSYTTDEVLEAVLDRVHGVILIHALQNCVQRGLSAMAMPTHLVQHSSAGYLRCIDISSPLLLPLDQQLLTGDNDIELEGRGVFRHSEDVGEG